MVVPTKAQLAPHATSSPERAGASTGPPRRPAVATTGIKRRFGEAEQSMQIESVLAALRAAKTPNVPPGSRLTDLNVRRNTSVHGEWVEVLDKDAVEDAISAARQLLNAVRHCLAASGIDVS